MAIPRPPPRKKRRTFVHQEGFWERQVPLLPEDRFIGHYRMSRALFNWLCDQLREDLVRDELGMKCLLLCVVLLSNFS